LSPGKILADAQKEAGTLIKKATQEIEEASRAVDALRKSAEKEVSQAKQKAQREVQQLLNQARELGQREGEEKAQAIIGVAIQKSQGIINEAVERGNRKWEKESAGVIAVARSKAEQEAEEIIAAAKQTAKQIVFQAFQRSLGTLLDKSEAAQEDEEDDGSWQAGKD